MHEHVQFGMPPRCDERVRHQTGESGLNLGMVVAQHHDVNSTRASASTSRPSSVQQTADLGG